MNFNHVKMNTSLTAKMVLITIIVGLAVWFISDKILVKSHENIYREQLYERLRSQIINERMSFDMHIKAFYQLAKLITSQTRFNRYIENLNTTAWSGDSTHGVKYYLSPPPWYPDLSLLRAFSQASYSVLIDDRGNVREAYLNRDKILPDFLHRPLEYLVQLSQNSSYLTSIDGTPYVITSRQFAGTQEGIRGTLILASPIDDQFLADSSYSSMGCVSALLSGPDAIILTSSDLDLLPAGKRADALKEDYIVLGQPFYDYGDSDLLLKYSLFIPKTEIRSHTKDLITTERIKLGIVSFTFILSFSLIMAFITKRIHRLANKIENFSRNTLGITSQKAIGGDEIRILEEKYRLLADGVIASTARMQEELIEREKVERDLMESKERFKALADLLPEVVFETDEKGYFTYVNKYAMDTTGYTPEDIEKGLSCIETFVPEDRERATRNFMRRMQGEDVGNVEYRMLKRDGEVFRAIVRAERILEKGRPAGIRGVVIDITKLKEAEENLKKAHNELELKVKERTSELTAANEALEREIFERVRAEDKIKASLKEKEILIKEIHHRVKNNMQVISSLLMLQSDIIKSREAKKAFENSISRIKSMALVHERLYRSDNLSKIDLNEYIREMLLGFDHNKAEIRQDISIGELSIDMALPMGLIINELISNSIEHAFQGTDEARIEIKLNKTERGDFQLTVCDNGIGLPDNIDLRKDETFGLFLVNIFIKQLEGSMVIHRNNGTTFEITFPSTDKLGRARI